MDITAGWGWKPHEVRLLMWEAHVQPAGWSLDHLAGVVRKARKAIDDCKG